LKDLFTKYEKAGFLGHQRRSASELVLGYLDLAGSEHSDARRARSHLSAAKQWLEKCEALVSAENAVDKAVCDLYRARYLILADELGKASSTLANVEKQKHLRRDSVEECLRQLLQCRVDLLKGELNAALKEVNGVLALVSSPKMSGGVRTAGTMDPVLEAECYLVACRIFKQLGDDNSLSLYLEKWNNVSPFIDNYYLHHDAKALPLPGKKGTIPH